MSVGMGEPEGPLRFFFEPALIIDAGSGRRFLRDRECREIMGVHVRADGRLYLVGGTACQSSFPAAVRWLLNLLCWDMASLEAGFSCRTHCRRMRIEK